MALRDTLQDLNRHDRFQEDCNGRTDLAPSQGYYSTDLFKICLFMNLQARILQIVRNIGFQCSGKAVVGNNRYLPAHLTEQGPDRRKRTTIVISRDTVRRSLVPLFRPCSAGVLIDACFQNSSLDRIGRWASADGLQADGRRTTSHSCVDLRRHAASDRHAAPVDEQVAANQGCLVEGVGGIPGGVTLVGGGSGTPGGGAPGWHMVLGGGTRSGGRCRAGLDA